mgnify:CR=1 FL=1
MLDGRIAVELLGVEQARLRQTLADLRAYDFANVPYDWVLVNSFLHHLDDGEVRATLESIARISAARVLVLELVLPALPERLRKFAALLGEPTEGRVGAAA